MSLTIDKRNTVIEFKNKSVTWRNSYELNKYVSEFSKRKAYLSFSGGKDSVGCYLYMKETGFWDDIQLVFYQDVPDLSFANESMAYYEKIWNTKIIQLPSPATISWMQKGIFQSPYTNMVIKKYRNFLRPASLDNTDIWIREDKKEEYCYLGTGVRMADGINRRGVILQNGGLRDKVKKFYPCFDLTDKEVYEIIKHHNVKLPYDYAVWGRSFDGEQYRFIKDLYLQLPEDYEQIKAFFPEIETVLYRYAVKHTDKLFLSKDEILIEQKLLHNQKK